MRVCMLCGFSNTYLVYYTNETIRRTKDLDEMNNDIALGMCKTRLQRNLPFVSRSGKPNRPNRHWNAVPRI